MESSSTIISSLFMLSMSGCVDSKAEEKTLSLISETYFINTYQTVNGYYHEHMRSDLLF